MSSGYRFRDQPLQQIMPEVLSAMHYIFAPPPRITYHKVNAWVLNYPREITGVLLKTPGLEQWLPVRPNTANLFPAGVKYLEDYRNCTSRPCRSDYIIFSPGRYGVELLRLCENTAGFCRFQDPEGLLGDSLRQAATLAAGGEARSLAVSGTLNLILDLLMNYTAPSEKDDYTRIASGRRSPQMKNVSLAERLTRLFNENPAAPFSIDYLAERLNVSRSTLSHSYARDSGESPMKTITRLRVSLCRELLKRDQPVKLIAGQCGFCDEFHLMKTFKHLTGMTVTQYRDSIR